jgi:hypothetical protein
MSQNNEALQVNCGGGNRGKCPGNPAVTRGDSDVLTMPKYSLKNKSSVKWGFFYAIMQEITYKTRIFYKNIISH